MELACRIAVLPTECSTVRGAESFRAAVAVDSASHVILLIAFKVRDRSPDPADVAAERLAIDDLLQTLADPLHLALAKAWNTAVALTDKKGRTSGEQQRLKYARQILRRSGLDRLVA